MAREVHERENLLRDARALSPRAQLHVSLDGSAVALFIGFRGESLSLYFGDDPVFHFNAAGQLRRAFVDGSLIKAENGQLIALRRLANAEAVELVGGPLDADAQKRMMDELGQRLAELRRAFEAASYRVDGQAPAEGDAVGRLLAWLAANSNPSIAASPRVN
jgi:hypothetical protein